MPVETMQEYSVSLRNTDVWEKNGTNLFGYITEIS